MSRTVSDNLKVVQTLKPEEARSSDTNGQGVDTKDIANDDLLVVANVGLVDDADGDETYKIKIQESSDDGNSDAYADTGDEFSIDRTDDEDSVVLGQVLGVGTTRERYLRAVLVAGGTSPDIDVSVEFVFKTRSQPVNSN